MPDLDQEINNRQTTLRLNRFSTVFVIGVGGVGSWVALDLALSGQVDRLELIDPDIVEISNLNRTPFRLCDIGVSKVVAMKYLILERRAVEIIIHQKRTDEEFVQYAEYAIDSQRSYSAIIDCRDDVFTDLYNCKCKYYKIGYDGLGITIDGNPRTTAVWSRANGYQVTPSFICPAQLVANLVTADLLINAEADPNWRGECEEEIQRQSTSGEKLTQYTVKLPFDEFGRLNTAATIDTKILVETMYRIHAGKIRDAAQ